MSVHNFLHNSDDDDDDYVEDPVTLISRLDISDPLHLHRNDSIALTVVSIKLKGTKNYQVWSCAMLLALEGKNKTGFIDGSYRRSNTDELKALWKQFDPMVELPKCICNASESFKKHNQLMKLMQFLMRLDDSYMQIISSFLSRELLHDVRSAFATISSEKFHRVAFSSKVEVLLWSVRTVGLMVILLICFKIIGYPTDFRENKLGQNFKGKNVFNNDSVGSSSSSEFTDEQMATFISLIKYNKIGKNVQVNMAGANQHMTYIDKELDNMLDIAHLKIKVGHSNGTKAFISKNGNLKLSNGLILYVMLVIPEYCVTLFSVHNLVRENKIIVAFDESRCYFLNHDLNLRNILAIGNQCEGLYYYVIKMPYDDRVDPNLNSDKKSKSDSSHSSVPGGDVTILEDNIFSEGNLDQNPSTSTQGTQTLNINSEPKSFYEASKFTHWTDAMNNEMDALVRYDTWDIVDLPKDRKSRGSKWIFKIKYKPSGEINRFKVRLVAQDFGQKEGIDYEENFSLVVKIVTVKCLLNITVSNSWHVFQLNVNDAFLYGDLAETVYMKPSEGKYVLDLLSENCMLACKHAKTPLMSKLVISNEASDNDHILDNITDYQKLMDLNCEVLLPVTLHCDSTIEIAVNPVFHERIKHLKIDLHFVREKILKGVVKTVKVDSANQIANILTTGLDTVQHKELVKKLEMVDICQVETKGGCSS
ncbi:ribonuclease H-like domain-containing protein [Tanacetum coccineum]